MRIVVLSPSIYSETACAAATLISERGFMPIAALSLRSWNRSTLVRKVAQWGLRGVLRYARSKIGPGATAELRNPYLAEVLPAKAAKARNLREVASMYKFPCATCADQNSDESVAKLKSWAPDVIVFTGGNILRHRVLEVPRLGVLNVHLGLLPEVRGMSSPEWSLLKGIPPGITIHFVDAGIDTGPVFLRRSLPLSSPCDSLADLRNRLVAFGVEQLVGLISDLERGVISPQPQAETNNDHQYFVIHDRLRDVAASRLQANTRANISSHA